MSKLDQIRGLGQGRYASREGGPVQRDDGVVKSRANLIQIGLTPEMLVRLDNARKKEVDLPTRPEMIRRILEASLK